MQPDFTVWLLSCNWLYLHEHYLLGLLIYFNYYFMVIIFMDNNYPYDLNMVPYLPWVVNINYKLIDDVYGRDII